MIEQESTASQRVHIISIVVPVYQGEKTLHSLLAEIVPLTEQHETPEGALVRVAEVVLVHDNGPDRSDVVIRELVAAHPFVHAVWLSRNFGQHAATLAGMASSGGDWIATIDEDGQHDPKDIDRLLDTALAEHAGVVYAQPTNASSHGVFRDGASRGAKWVLRKIFGGGRSADYQSFRLVLGELGRSVAAYAGTSIYLDVALNWVNGRMATTAVELRDEGDRRSGYSLKTLLSHFLRMVLSTGTRGLRAVAGIGVFFALAGVVTAIYFVILRLASGNVPAGWTSTIVVILLSSGVTLFSLGVIAEYLGVAVNMAMGKPLYLITRDPLLGPLGERGGVRRHVDATHPLPSLIEDVPTSTEPTSTEPTSVRPPAEPQITVRKDRAHATTSLGKSKSDSPAL